MGTLDACEKYEETAEKVNRKEKALAKSEIRAKGATDQSSQMESKLNSLGLQLGAKENSREKVINRTEQVAKKVRQLQAQLKEAESRADQVDQAKERVEIILDQTRRERESVAKKVQESNPEIKEQHAQLQQQQQK